MVETDFLISLVEARPVLWDKTLESYKNRNATRDAWREVFCELKEGFEELEENEKNAFGKEVIKRWGNLRDAFSKSKRKLKECKKSGAGASNVKKYIYTDQMQFLNKLFQSREVVESLEDSNGNIDQEDSDNEGPQQSPALLETQAASKDKQVRKEKSGQNNTGQRKRRCPDEVELKMLKALEQQEPSAHMLFFQGLLPHVNKFNDSEVLEFQMGVLQVISRIKNKSTPQPLPPQTPPTYYYQSYNYPVPQPPPFPQPYPGHQFYNSQHSSKQPPETQQGHQQFGQHSAAISENNSSGSQSTCGSDNAYHDFSSLEVLNNALLH